MIRRTTVVLVLVACAFICAQVARADELKLHANRVYVPVTINGLTAEALLDSAAEGTFVGLGQPKGVDSATLTREGVNVTADCARITRACDSRVDHALVCCARMARS